MDRKKDDGETLTNDAVAPHEKRRAGALHEELEDTKTRRSYCLRVTSPMTAEQEVVVSRVVDVGFTVHSFLGPGFKERIYHRAFCLELDSRGLKFESEKLVEVVYKQWTIPGQRIDLIVENICSCRIEGGPSVAASAPETGPLVSKDYKA